MLDLYHSIRAFLTTLGFAIVGILYLFAGKWGWGVTFVAISAATVWHALQRRKREGSPLTKQDEAILDTHWSKLRRAEAEEL